MDLISNALQIMMNEDGADVEPITIRQNGEYTAPEGKAYSPVTVQVPSISVSKLTVGHNNVTYEAGIGTAFDPVEVSIPMDTLNAPSNGVYEIDTTTQDGWDTVVVDTYEKYNMLYWGNFTGIAYNHFFEDARIYDELWLVGYYITYGNKLALWSSRYPIDAVYEFANKRFCMQGSDNYSWVIVNSDGYGATPIDQYGSCTPLAYIGIKNNEREQTLLWKNSETTTPNTITLSDSIFNYDEIFLQFINTSDGQYNTAVWFPTSQLSINDTVYGYNDYNSYISKYTIMAGDTLSKISEAGYRLYAVYGVNDSSMQETVLFTNPSDSTMPATVTLSDAYTNYDEIALIGHAINDDIKGSQYYPVKIIATGSSMQNMYSRLGIFTDTTNCWLEFTSDTTLVPDANPGMIVDKIIGIKRPVISVAHELIDVEPLSVTTNGTYTAPTGKAYSPVSVDVQPTLGTKSITTNGTYTASSDNLDGYSSVTVNVHDDKYDLLYGNWYEKTHSTYGDSIGTKRFVKPITEYDDILIWTSYDFQSHEWTNFMRYPVSEIIGKNYNMVASGGNYVTGSISADGAEITDTGVYYQAIVAVYGIEVNNMERTTIFENTGSTNPATYPLPTGKTFSDYDEFIIIGEKDNYVYASYVPTSEIYVNGTWFGITIGSVGKTMYFSDNSTITDDATQTILVKKIIGVKYGE